MTQQRHSGPGRPYRGPAGRTRTERIRVFRAGSTPIEAEVFRVVNTDDYPELREPALDGELHLLDDGERADVPFVFHDPSARHFVLVVPEEARGRELSERAKLLESLMSDPDEEVPEYVRHFTVVYGSAGLSRFVADSETMEVDVAELEPVDGGFVASYFPRLAGLLPDADFWEHASTELAPLIDEGELWLFVRVEDDAFAESSSDLLVQLKTVEQLPVCVLTLVDDRAGVTRRAFLNPAHSIDRPVLELLRNDFHANVVVFDGERRLRRAFRVEAPRGPNVRLILDRAERAPSSSRDRWRDAVDLCRSTPPPVAAGEHPFVNRDPAPDAGEALRRLRQLEAWSTPDRVDEALLLKSIPKTTFELARRRIVADALRFGLAMSDSLVLQAVRFGFASSTTSLVEALIRRFEEIVPSASEHSLDQAGAAANLEALRRLAQMHGTSTAPALSCNMDHSG